MLVGPGGHRAAHDVAGAAIGAQAGALGCGMEGVDAIDHVAGSLEPRRAVVGAAFDGPAIHAVALAGEQHAGFGQGLGQPEDDDLVAGGT